VLNFKTGKDNPGNCIIVRQVLKGGSKTRHVKKKVERVFEKQEPQVGGGGGNAFAPC